MKIAVMLGRTLSDDRGDQYRASVELADDTRPDETDETAHARITERVREFLAVSIGEFVPVTHPECSTRRREEHEAWQKRIRERLEAARKVRTAKINEWMVERDVALRESRALPPHPDTLSEGERGYPDEVMGM